MYAPTFSMRERYRDTPAHVLLVVLDFLLGLFSGFDFYGKVLIRQSNSFALLFFGGFFCSVLFWYCFAFIGGC